MNINAYFLKGLFFGLLFDWEADDVRSELYLPVKESDSILPSLSARSEGSLSVERGAKFSKNERENKHRHQGGKSFYQDTHIDRLHLWLEVNFLFLLKINFFCQN
jgi:hypothetical protein